MGEQFATVDEYIASFPAEVQPVLERVRGELHGAAPSSIETISYGMPTMMLDGRRLAYFAGWRRHVALYAVPPMRDDLERQLAPYRGDKGTLSFPYSEPVPYGLIRRLADDLVRLRRRVSG
ncbi:iron chaperone [Lacisediminihabitans sp.]|uniref:iron chaperone n=1 Tax=Lacisediminihabitans sp. TaxID=2787631 RepID=UPI00374D598F